MPKKINLLLCILILFIGSTSFSFLPHIEIESPEQKVIICTGKYAKRYHNSICRGMKSCKGEQKKVKLSEAKKMGLTPCRYCYK